ncbi:hypothetical protein [Methylovirgula sp. 4M-Z18]|uniref:hypothetical protein n=1 Tax=Methylovirgula sp. 4M-Z18 TaxID=2293567 RepID=UPI000E2E64B2|nr:hypothetical protein [Methylovirgula sp. 4M-Z18]RFB80006.1 hypothetical protein DYH55_00185 [Methylovirgula sp. 4M-Z18]
MLADAQKTDIRRFCGYPVLGNVASTGFGERFTTQYGALEYKLNNLSSAEEAVLTGNYLVNLPLLEQALINTGANLDTAEAAVWKHNPRELSDRETLFLSLRLKLCGFLGVPPGPALRDSGSVKLVV